MIFFLGHPPQAKEALELFRQQLLKHGTYLLKNNRQISKTEFAEALEECRSSFFLGFGFSLRGEAQKIAERKTYDKIDILRILLYLSMVAYTPEVLYEPM